MPVPCHFKLGSLTLSSVIFQAMGPTLTPHFVVSYVTNSPESTLRLLA